MRVQRTIPPVAAMLCWQDIWNGLSGFFHPSQHIHLREKEIRHYFDSGNVFLVSSGKAALYVILEALKTLSPDRTQVVIPAYTCFSVPSAIIKAGLKVIPCDINPSTMDFNYSLLEKLINKDTLCILPTHLFGIPAEIEKVRALCKDEGIFLVEDAAQAMGGVNKNGAKLGALGDVGFFSLGRGKNITCGSGGIILTRSPHIAEAIRARFNSLENPSKAKVILEFLQLLFMVIFIRPTLYWFPAGLPFLKLGKTIFHDNFSVNKLAGMQAGILKNWRTRLEAAQRNREELADWFHKRLEAPLMPLATMPYLRMPLLIDSRENRDKLYAVSQDRGLGLSLMYPAPVNEIEELRDYFTGQDFPAARSIAERLLTIPTHYLLSNKDIEEIDNLLSSFGLMSKSQTHL